MVRGRATVRDLGEQSGYRIKRGGDTERSWAEGSGQGRALLTSSLEGLGVRGAEEAVEEENGCCSWY